MKLQSWYKDLSKDEKTAVMNAVMSRFNCERVTARFYLNGSRPIQVHHLRALSVITKGGVSVDDLITDAEKQKNTPNLDNSTKANLQD